MKNDGNFATNIFNNVMKNKKILVIIAFFVIVFGAISSTLQTANLIVGPEGIRALNYGVQFGTTGSVLKASTAETLPSKFFWSDNSPSSTVIGRSQVVDNLLLNYFLYGTDYAYKGGSSKIRSEIQHPVIQSDPIGVSPQTIEYYQQTSKGIKQVVCQIKPVDFVIQISAVTGSGAYTWKDVNLWYVLDSVVWQNAFISNPSDNISNSTLKFSTSSYRGAYPIIAWIEGYKDNIYTDSVTNTIKTGYPDDKTYNYVQTNPSLEGRYIDLYSAASGTYDLALSSESGESISDANVKQKCSPNNLPDNRLSTTAYMKIGLTNFGAYVQPTGIFGSYSSSTTWYPSTYYRIRVVYAIYGEYVYQWNSANAGNVGYNNNTWQVRTTTTNTNIDPITGAWNAAVKGWNDFWSNPFSGIGVAVFFLIIIFGGIILLLFWFKGNPKGDIRTIISPKKSYIPQWKLSHNNMLSGGWR